MGRYNPHAPYIVGQEWAPIRSEPVEIPLDQELGYSFTLDSPAQIGSGAYYLTQVPPEIPSGKVVGMSVYRRGQEDATGPVHSVVIPVTSATITGATSVDRHFNPVPVATALATPADDTFVVFTTGAGFQGILMYFDTVAHTELTGKRILGISLLAVVSFATQPPGLGGAAEISVQNATMTAQGDTFFDQALTSFGAEWAYQGGNVVQEVFLGETNPLWMTTMNPNFQVNRLPWRYTELQRMDPSAASGTRFGIFFQGGPPSGFTGQFAEYHLHYAAMKVYYCEETRVAYGGVYHQSATPGTQIYFRSGPNAVPLYDTTFTTPVVLPAGDYTVVVTQMDDGDSNNAGVPAVNAALRELYPMPNQPGVAVTKFKPPGTAPTVAASAVLPQLSLHATGGAGVVTGPVVTGIHPYGVQVQAPVYNGVTATQDVEDDVIPPLVGSPLFPQARFYARRFGDQDAPLVLTGTTQPGSPSAQITAADFDALPEIVDGWREVNLRFDAPTPSFTAGAGAPDWRWSSTAAVANQWQVLGADAPTVSGYGSLDTATYYAPTGNTQLLNWNGVSDTSADATLIFSQDPPTVTGLTVTQLSQPVTGIGLDCTYTPGCIPTGIGYHQVTWSAVSSGVLPVTGFGRYELQRFDTLDGEWQTVMDATAPTVTGFADYEARIGIESKYRIRCCNALDFCGLWSAEVTSTLPAPGVSGTSCDNSILVFTSNTSQAGLYNLAHAAVWEDKPSEDFVFVEAGRVKFQTMYGRDFQVAFHGTERGGERFARTLLVNNAAIAPERLADFHSLRDMAWADLPYVCVRDEIGDRWYANVLVPGGAVRRNRKLYLAPVDITEVTDTACPVDPANP